LVTNVKLDGDKALVAAGVQRTEAITYKQRLAPKVKVEVGGPIDRQRVGEDGHKAVP
jgi:hypothetical protein